MSESTSSDNHAFGFQLTTEQTQVLLQWQDDATNAVTAYQLKVLKQKNPILGLISNIFEIIVTPHGVDRWQLKMHLVKRKLLPVIDPLVITEGIMPVHDKGNNGLTIQRNDYQRLLETGWGFAHAHKYDYLFVPSSIGIFVSVRPIGHPEWIHVYDDDEF